MMHMSLLMTGLRRTVFKTRFSGEVGVQIERVKTRFSGEVVVQIEREIKGKLVEWNKCTW